MDWAAVIQAPPSPQEAQPMEDNPPIEEPQQPPSAAGPSDEPSAPLSPTSKRALELQAAFEDVLGDAAADEPEPVEREAEGVLDSQDPDYDGGEEDQDGAPSSQKKTRPAKRRRLSQEKQAEIDEKRRRKAEELEEKRRRIEAQNAERQAKKEAERLKVEQREKERLEKAEQKKREEEERLRKKEEAERAVAQKKAEQEKLKQKQASVLLNFVKKVAEPAPKLARVDRLTLRPAAQLSLQEMDQQLGLGDATAEIPVISVAEMWARLRAQRKPRNFRNFTSKDRHTNRKTINGVVHRMRLIQFSTNRRPAYFGTFIKTSKVITARRPFAQDTAIFDYEVDSDEDWEEEEKGESLTDSEAEKEKDKDEDEEEHDEEDAAFVVPDGYLSQDEGLNDEEDLKVQRKTLADGPAPAVRIDATALMLIQPTLSSSSSQLSAYAVVPLEPYKMPIKIRAPERHREEKEKATDKVDVKDAAPTSPDHLESSDKEKTKEKRAVGAKSAPVPDAQLPLLVKIVHDSRSGMAKLIAQFLAYSRAASKLQIEKKIREIAQRSDTTGRWVVAPAIFSQIGLAEAELTSRDISTFGTLLPDAPDSSAPGDSTAHPAQPPAKKLKTATGAVPGPTLADVPSSDAPGEAAAVPKVKQLTLAAALARTPAQPQEPIQSSPTKTVAVDRADAAKPPVPAATPQKPAPVSRAPTGLLRFFQPKSSKPASEETVAAEPVVAATALPT